VLLLSLERHERQRAENVAPEISDKHKWITTALLEAEKKFPKLRACKSMAVLVNALALEQQRKQNKLGSNGNPSLRDRKVASITNPQIVSSWEFQLRTGQALSQQYHFYTSAETVG